MNCKNFQDLLPLHAGRDTDEKQAFLVDRHLESCAECAISASEYYEAGQLLQMFEPPVFGEDDYADIRSRVWQEIERKPSAGTFSQLPGYLFRPRVRIAFASALMLAIAGFSYYFIANQATIGPQVAGSFAPDRNTIAANPELVILPPSQKIENDAPAIVKTDNRVARMRRSTERKDPKPVLHRSETIKAQEYNRSMAVKDREEGNNEPAALLVHNEGKAQRTVRMEMQTRDPNIRIIWFSPLVAKRDSK